MSLPSKDTFVNVIPMQQTPNGKYQNISSEDPDAQLESLRNKDAKSTRRIIILRFITRILSTILSALIAASMAYSLAKYLRTRNNILPGNVHPWAVPTVLWPTLMLLAMSFVEFASSVIVMATYCCRNGVKRVEKVDDITGYINYAMLAGQLIAWAVVTGLFKMANTGRDLWGWSCGTESDKIQEEVQSFLNFGQLCTVQTGSFAITVLQTVVYALTFITYVVVARQVLQKKKMKKFELLRGERAF